MKIVKLIGWRPGLKKVLLNKLLRRKAGYNLESAQEAVVQLLNGYAVEVHVKDEDEADFVLEAQNLGVVCERAV